VSPAPQIIIGLFSPDIKQIIFEVLPLRFLFRPYKLSSRMQEADIGFHQLNRMETGI